MQKLTQEEMKNVNAALRMNFGGCNSEGTKCCIGYYTDSGYYLGMLCGPMDWYLQA